MQMEAGIPRLQRTSGRSFRDSRRGATGISLILLSLVGRASTGRRGVGSAGTRGAGSCPGFSRIRQTPDGEICSPRRNGKVERSHRID